MEVTGVGGGAETVLLRSLAKKESERNGNVEKLSVIEQTRFQRGSCNCI